MKQMPAAPAALVLSDADNTLWDTNAVFAEAQLALLTAVEDTLGRSVPATEDRLALVRAFDQELAERHHASLNYPVHFLVRALGLAVSGVEPAIAARRVLSGSAPVPDLSSSDIGIISSSFEERLTQAPRLRPGVRKGLQALHGLACLVVIVTEGSKERCRYLVDMHEIKEFVDKINMRAKTSRIIQKDQKTCDG